MTRTRRMPTLWISLLVFLSFFVSSTGFGQSLRPDGQTVQAQSEERPGAAPSFRVMTHPTERHLQRGRPFNGDVRTLPQTRPVKIERPEFEEPEITPVPYPGTVAIPQGSTAALTSGGPSANPPAPSASNSFEGLDFTNWGAGHKQSVFKAISIQPVDDSSPLAAHGGTSALNPRTYPALRH
jgi:hypothetical protein